MNFKVLRTSLSRRAKKKLSEANLNCCTYFSYGCPTQVNKRTTHDASGRRAADACGTTRMRSTSECCVLCRPTRRPALQQRCALMESGLCKKRLRSVIDGMPETYSLTGRGSTVSSTRVYLKSVMTRQPGGWRAASAPPCTAPSRRAMRNGRTRTLMAAVAPAACLVPRGRAFTPLAYIR